MNGFRGSHAGAALAVLIALTSVPFDALAVGPDDNAVRLPAVLLAQAPKRLLPRNPPEVAPEKPGSPAQPESPALENPFATPRSGIEVNPLRGPDPEEIGTIDEVTGGLARDMWKEVPAELVTRLIRQLPDRMPSPTMRDLLRRLLLTAAQPPVQSGEGEPIRLVPLRVEKLQSLGLLGAASELADMSPGHDTNQALLRLRAQNLLMRGNNAGACAETRKPGVPLAKRYWQTLLIFCQILDGNIPEASFGASLLAESGEPVDPTFMALVDGFVSGKMPVIERVETPTALTIAMLRRAKLAFPAQSLDGTAPPLLAMIASNPEADQDLRLQAAERAVHFGAMTAARLRSVYAAVPFSGEELNNALSTAGTVRSARSRALLYQAAAAHTVDAARAELLQKALAIAREDGVYALSLAVYQPMLEGLGVSSALSWFAADAARALYSLGQVERARSWLQVLHYEAIRDPAVAQTLNALWALRAIASAPETPDQTFGTMTAWRTTMKQVSPETESERLTTANFLFRIQGVPVDGVAWRELLDGYETYTARLPRLAYRAALKAAADERRLGETVLLALIVAGGQPVAEIDLTVLSDVAGALQLVGLGKEAHALVLEAAVEKGI